MSAGTMGGSRVSWHQMLSLSLSWHVTVFLRKTIPALQIRNWGLVRVRCSSVVGLTVSEGQRQGFCTRRVCMHRLTHQAVRGWPAVGGTWDKFNSSSGHQEAQCVLSSSSSVALSLLPCEMKGPEQVAPWPAALIFWDFFSAELAQAASQQCCLKKKKIKVGRHPGAGPPTSCMAHSTAAFGAALDSGKRNHKEPKVEVNLRTQDPA